MADLNLNTVELTSTLRTAPLNGSPSSSDYNEGQRETLVDLATLSGFLNDTLIPLLNALPEGALEPTEDPVGIEGRTIWTDTSDQSTLFFDALGSTPLTVADSLRVVNGIITTMRQQLIDQGVEVASLQARLASTNQNDIALALQNLSSSLNQVTVNQSNTNVTISQIQSVLSKAMRSSVTTIPSGTTATVTLTWPIAFNDDFYSVTVGVELTDTISGLVYAGGFTKTVVGMGIVVAVTNHDSVDHDVIVHAVANHD